MSNKTTCWACGEEIEADLLECPHCNMILDESGGDDDLDDLLSSVSDEESKESKDLDIDFDDLMIEETETTELKSVEVEDLIEDSELEPSLPSFDDEPALPDFGDEFDDMPMMPDFDEGLFGDEEEIETTLDIEEEIEYGLTPRKWASILGTQWLYWSIFFLFLSIASVAIRNPNFNPQNITYSGAVDLEIYGEFFLLAWIAFIPMAFHYGYSIRKAKVEPIWKYGIAFIAGFIGFYLITIFILLLLLNPGFFSENYNTDNYVITGYLWYAIFNFLAALLSGGIIIFGLFYRPAWRYIYHLTPLSKVDKMDQFEIDDAQVSKAI